MEIGQHYINAAAFAGALQNEDVDVKILASLAQLNQEWARVAGKALDDRREMHVIRRWLPFVQANGDVEDYNIQDTHLCVSTLARVLETMGAIIKRKKGSRRPNLDAALSDHVCIVTETDSELQNQHLCLNTLDFLLKMFDEFKKPECITDEVSVEMVLMYHLLTYILNIVKTVYPGIAHRPGFLMAFLDRIRVLRSDLKKHARTLPPVIMRRMLEVIHDTHVVFSRHVIFETHYMAIAAAFQ